MRVGEVVFRLEGRRDGQIRRLVREDRKEVEVTTREVEEEGWCEREAEGVSGVDIKLVPNHVTCMG